MLTLDVTITIKISNETVRHVIKGIMENFPEASRGCVLRCTDWRYAACQFEFIDEETGKKYKLDRDKLEAAFPLMLGSKWPRGCTRPPVSDNKEVWDDWLDQSDAIDYDAFIQLACLDEVIYG